MQLAHLWTQGVRDAADLGLSGSSSQKPDTVGSQRDQRVFALVHRVGYPTVGVFAASVSTQRVPL